MESADVESPVLPIGLRRRVIVLQVVAILLGVAIALLGIGAALATLYLRAWSALGRDSAGPEGAYLFLFAAVVAGTVLLEVGVRFATKRVVHRLRTRMRETDGTPTPAN